MYEDSHISDDDVVQQLIRAIVKFKESNEFEDCLLSAVEEFKKSTDYTQAMVRVGTEQSIVGYNDVPQEVERNHPRLDLSDLHLELVKEIAYLYQLLPCSHLIYEICFVSSLYFLLPYAYVCSPLACWLRLGS